MTEPIAIIGAGRVGGALAELWSQAGLDVVRVATREHDLAETVGMAAWIVLAIPDDGLLEMAEALAALDAGWDERVVLHTSGFHSAAVLRALGERGAAVGSLHPLQSIPSTGHGIERIPGCTFAIDGAADAERVATQLATAAGGRAVAVPHEARALYHAAAVLASNAVVALLDAALEVMIHAGMSEEDARLALAPLVHGTTDNVAALSTGRALTGPVARGDAGTVEGHIDALARIPRPASNRVEPGVLEIYKLLNRRALGIQARSGNLSNSHLIIAKRLKEK